MTHPLNRRDFLAQSTAATSAVALGAGVIASSSNALGATSRIAANKLPDSPVSRVALGKTGIMPSLIGMGTGTVGVGQASNQTRLGIKEFTRIVRHALDKGLNLFDVADQYGSHAYLKKALDGVPRDRYVIQTKTHAANFADARSHVERFRMDLNVDYIDILLLHCMQKADFSQQFKGAREYLSEAKEKGFIRAHGTSCHGIDPLRAAAKDPWVQVDLARINPEGKIMDAAPDVVASELEEMHNAGKGVIGMKIFAEGRIKDPEKRDASLRHVLSLGSVDCFIIGFESPNQIDDVIKRVDAILTSLKAEAKK